MSDTEKKWIRSCKGIALVLFALVFQLVVYDGFSSALKRIYESPDLASDYSWVAAIALVITVGLAGFVMGTAFKRHYKIMAIVVTLPIMAILILRMAYFEPLPEYQTKIYMIGLFALILSPLASYYGAIWGNQQSDQFGNKPNSVLGIKWYHWLWIFPFYLNKVVAVPLLVLLSMWSLDFASPHVFTSFIFDFPYIIIRTILFAIFVGLLMSVGHAYEIMTGHFSQNPKWKNSLMVFGHVLLLSVLYFVFIGSYLMSFQTE